MSAAVAVLPPTSIWWNADSINLRISQIDPVLAHHTLLATAAVVLLLEAVRRAVAPALAAISAVMLAYLFLTEFMPGALHYRDLPPHEIAETMYLSGSQGVFGFITGISAQVVAVFIIFGAFIEGTGSGRLFMNIGTKAAGRLFGGPAKVEVVASALFGMISGSSAANVASTGTFTIPSMIKRGYSPTFAGRVEAASSVGGQIMPPIMGAAAFIMAETTQIPYSRIIVAAAAGAALYFFAIFMTVHFEAKKRKLEGLAASELPSWREIGRDIHLVSPIILLLVLLWAQFSPNFAAFWSIVCMFAVANCGGTRASGRVACLRSWPTGAKPCFPSPWRALAPTWL